MIKRLFCTCRIPAVFLVIYILHPTLHFLQPGLLKSPAGTAIQRFRIKKHLNNPVFPQGWLGFFFSIFFALGTSHPGSVFFCIKRAFKNLASRGTWQQIKFTAWRNNIRLNTFLQRQLRSTNGPAFPVIISKLGNFRGGELLSIGLHLLNQEFSILKMI